MKSWAIPPAAHPGFPVSGSAASVVPVAGVFFLVRLRSLMSVIVSSSRGGYRAADVPKDVAMIVPSILRETPHLNHSGSAASRFYDRVLENAR